MAHYAKVVDGIVSQVIVAEADFFNTFVDTSPGQWIQTSYNTHGGVHANGGTPLRKNYAGVGYTYDAVRDAFIPPKPYASWTLNEETCLWDAPTPMPTDGQPYSWDEAEREEQPQPAFSPSMTCAFRCFRLLHSKGTKLEQQTGSRTGQRSVVTGEPTRSGTLSFCPDRDDVGAPQQKGRQIRLFLTSRFPLFVLLQPLIKIILQTLSRTFGLICRRLGHGVFDRLDNLNQGTHLKGTTNARRLTHQIRRPIEIHGKERTHQSQFPSFWITDILYGGKIVDVDTRIPRSGLYTGRNMLHLHRCRRGVGVYHLGIPVIQASRTMTDDIVSNSICFESAQIVWLLTKRNEGEKHRLFNGVEFIEARSVGGRGDVSHQTGVVTGWFVYRWTHQRHGWDPSIVIAHDIRTILHHRRPTEGFCRSTCMRHMPWSRSRFSAAV